jgi:hypothetical protein
MSLRLAREVSALHDKSTPRTTSLCLAQQVRLRLAHGPGRATKAHGSGTTTDACGGMISRAMQLQQLAAMQEAHPDKSLNAGLTG